MNVDDLFEPAKRDNSLLWWECLEGDAAELWDAVRRRCQNGERANRKRVQLALNALGVDVSYPTVQQAIAKIEEGAAGGR